MNMERLLPDIADRTVRCEDWTLWQQNHLETFCYYYAHNQLPPPLKSEFGGIFNFQSAHSLQLEHQWRLLKGVLLNAGIRFCPIKGVDLAFRVYSHPALRPMGDFDILIHPEDCEKAWQLVLENGWSTLVTYSHNHHFPLLCKGTFALELHFKLPGLPTLPPEEVFLTKDNEGVYRLPLSWNLIMLFAHAMNHQWQNGIRMLLDMSFLLKGHQWPTHEIKDLCAKWSLPNPELVRMAFPELFGEVEAQGYPEEMIVDFRHAIVEESRWQDCGHEILMSRSTRFSILWFRQRLKGFSPQVVRQKYGIYQGQYGRLLACYVKDFSEKWKIFWRYRHGTIDPELRAYVQRLERIQNHLQH